MKKLNKKLLESISIVKIHEQEEDCQIDKRLLKRVIKDVTSKIDDFQEAIDEIVAEYFALKTGVNISQSLVIDWSRRW